jgi:RNA polymerase sigma-70 factor (ECF subfamily)
VTEKELIQKCKNNDRKASAELFRIYAPRMMAICLRIVKDRDIAEDLVHDGFVVVFTRIGDFRDEGSFEGWIRRIFANLSLDYIRDNVKTERLEMMEEETDYVVQTDPDVLRKVGLEALMATIEKLPDDFRTIISLFSIEGYTHEEIAAMLNISVRSSESRLYRAKKMLVTLIENERRIG